MKTTELHTDQLEVIETLKGLVKLIVDQELDSRERVKGVQNAPDYRRSLRSHSIASGYQGDYSVADSELIKKLSRRELEVLTLVASGYSRNEISQSLGVQYNTACTHISNIYCKLSISTVAEATQIAMRSGVLSQRLEK